MNLLTELREGLRISLSCIHANKMRAALTTLGIIIGIVTVTLMGTIIEGMSRAFLTSISAIGTDVLYVQRFPWFGDEPWWKIMKRREIIIPEGQSFIRQANEGWGDAQAFLREANPAWTVTLEAVGIRTLRHGRDNATGVITIGATENAPLTGGLVLKEGRFMSASEIDGSRPVCVVGADIATNFFPQGSAVGNKVRIDDANYEIVGVLEKRGKFLGLENLDNTAYIPLTRIARELGFWSGIRIVVKVGNLSEIEESKEEVRSVMRRVRRLSPGDEDDFSINSMEAFIKQFNELGRVIAGVGLFITGLSLFVGGIGIMNIMFVSVAERTHEIGIRKALGAKRRTILLQFLIEAAAICLMGGLAGLSLAWLATLGINFFLPARMTLPMVGIALATSIFTGVAAGFFPAWRAARMNPVDALRAE